MSDEANKPESEPKNELAKVAPQELLPSTRHDLEKAIEAIRCFEAEFSGTDWYVYAIIQKSKNDGFYIICGIEEDEPHTCPEQYHGFIVKKTTPDDVMVMI